MGLKGAIGGWIVGFIVFALVVSDGPLPLGDAAAMMLLLAYYSASPLGETSAYTGHMIEEAVFVENAPPVVAQMVYFEPVTYYV